MRWIIGVDLRSGDGPIRLARWIAETSRGAGGEQLVFVHVLEEEHLRFVLRQHHMDDVTQSARREAERLLAAEGVRGELRIAQGLTAEDALEEVRAQLQGDAVILGRAAPLEGRRVVQLGRVARRMLRRLDSPVVVVPPDLRASDIGDGPIGVLTSLADDALGACRFAADAAARLGRPLVALHAARAALAPYLAPSATATAREAHGADAATALDAWLERHGLQPQGRDVLLGSPVGGATEWAERMRAPILVSGSRRLSDAERILRSSTGSSLAATAATAVAIVPP